MSVRSILKFAGQKRKAAPFGGAGNLRKDGDSARDRRDWLAAERSYEKYLAVQPSDAAIWIQMGHAAKEQGKLDAAETAYRRSIALEPENADAHMQLGHLLKRMGKRAEASKSFARSLEIVPDKSAFDEVRLLGGEQRAGNIIDAAIRQNAPDVVLFEVHDLIGWLHAHLTLSGIQRVQVGIVRHVLSEELGHAKGKYGFISTGNGRPGFWQIWPTDLHDILEHASQPDVDRGEMTRLLHKAEQAAVELTPAKGQCYFVLGAFWAFHPDAGRYVILKDAGVAVGVYIYDLIPITHPEYCDANLVPEFMMSLSDGLAVFDFILTISEFTATGVRQLQAKHGLRKVPVQAVPLAHVMTEEVLEEATSGWTPAIAGLRGKRFVLSVSTIEARKNHAYLIAAWRLMIDEGLDPPDLVFVGRYGWRVNDLMEQMKSTNYLDGRIHVLHGIADAELEMLYRHCLFTAFPSFVEGWGLPVGESLAHGRPCIASNNSSIPEVGGELVDYIDPYNVRAGAQAFSRMSFDHAYRAKRERNVKENFSARTWKVVAADMMQRIEQLRNAAAFASYDSLLKPGEVFLPRMFRPGQPVPQTYLERPLRLILASNWYPPEQFGVWMRGSTGILRFQTGLPKETKICIFLRLVGLSWSATQSIQVLANVSDEDSAKAMAAEAKPLVPSFPPTVTGRSGRKPIVDGAFGTTVDATVQGGGKISVTLNVLGSLDLSQVRDARNMSVGLVSLAYCKADDTELRMGILEQLHELG